MLTFRSPLVGESQAIKTIFNTIDKVSQTDSTVLITGESGTGKELVARAIHENSARAGKPWSVVNCGAIPSELLEAELFGVMKGAFTGALQDRTGRFQAAHTGTIFLDEIGELPIQLQVKLLRVLQTKQFEPVGSSKTIEVDVRIIAATNRDMEEAIQKKEFREDLYYRLNVIPVKIPSLRERKSDIPLLIHHFVQNFNQVTGHSVEAPSGQILEALMTYDWPGNVRELENVLSYCCMITEADTIDWRDLPEHIRNAQSSERAPADRLISMEEMERNYALQVLASTNGNRVRAAEILGISRATLYRLTGG